MADTPIHFFKVVIPQTLEDKNLRIPEKFVRKFGDELNDVAVLRVPNGRVWHLGLTKDGSKILFNDGWHDFVKYHSVCVGYFLVFKYGRDSNFDVLILDTTCCEIDYPYNGENDKRKSQYQHGVKSEDAVEVMDSRTPNPPPPSKQNQTKPSFESAPVPNRRRKRAASLESQTLECGVETRMKKKCKMEKLTEINESDDVAENQESVLLEEMGIFVSRKVTGQEKARLINAAKSLKPKSPSFMVILRSSGIKSKTVIIPLKFATKYMSREVKFIKLQVQGGRAWPAKVTWRRTGGPVATLAPSTRWSIWDELSKEKNLEEGDVCLFELIRKKDCLMKVKVFPCRS